MVEHSSRHSLNSLWPGDVIWWHWETAMASICSADPNQLAFILMHLPENDESNLTNTFKQALRHMPGHHSNSAMVSPTVVWWCHTATLKTQHWLRQGIGARQHQATDRTKADPNKLSIFPMHLPGILNRLMVELNAINWSSIYETDAQLGYTDFINLFKKVYGKCIPIRYVKRKVNPSKPWLTEGLMKCIKVKNKLYKERVKSLSPLRIEIYKRYRNKLNNIFRATEKDIMK